MCSGGILGLGEQAEDRVGLIHEVSRWVHICSTLISRMASHPESFPVNTLVPIEGTPLENNEVRQIYSK